MTSSADALSACCDGGRGGGASPSTEESMGISASDDMIILSSDRRSKRCNVEDLGGYVIRGMSKSVRPLCHQEVDAGMKDRRENIPFFWAHNSLGMSVCHFFCCLWTRP